jgi:hypothetical protein
MVSTVLRALLLTSVSTLAIADDNNVTNSNNTNTSTQSNVITYDNTGQDHSTTDYSVDSSTHDNHAVDSSLGDNRNNWADSSNNSHNQTNTSYQDINNSLTKSVGGDLIEGSNVGTNAGGTAITGASTSSAVAGSSVASTGDAISNGGSQGQKQGMQSSVVVAPNYSQTYKQVRQAPSVGAVVGIPSSNQRSCKSTVGGGASSPFGGINLIFGDGDELCETLLIADQMTAFGMPQVACNMLVNYGQNNDIEVAKAMAQAGVDCATIPKPQVQYVPSPTALDTEHKLRITPSVNGALDTGFTEAQYK